MAKKKHSRLKEQTVTLNNSNECILALNEKCHTIGSHIDKLFTKGLFSGIDIKIDVTFGEDYSMIVQLLDKSGKFLIIDKCLYI